MNAIQIDMLHFLKEQAQVQENTKKFDGIYESLCDMRKRDPNLQGVVDLVAEKKGITK